RELRAPEPPRRGGARPRHLGRRDLLPERHDLLRPRGAAARRRRLPRAAAAGGAPPRRALGVAPQRDRRLPARAPAPRPGLPEAARGAGRARGAAQDVLRGGGVMADVIRRTALVVDDS